MLFIYHYLFAAMWIGFIVYWRVKAANVKAAERSESVPSRMVRLVLIICAFLLLALPKVPLPFLNRRFLPMSISISIWSFWIGAAIPACGLLFAVWARHHLGANWSQEVTLKKDHELITSGPYALVRHPIYTGMLLGLVGSAVAVGEWRGVLAVALVFGGLWYKLSLEEKWMRSEFGETYEAYCRKVKALVPYVV